MSVVRISRSDEHIPALDGAHRIAILLVMVFY